MLASRQVWSRLAIADVVLFLIAAAFNDQGSTSVDGIIWWVAIAVFGVLIVVACVMLVGLIRSRARRPRRPRTR
jgi:intracellular septation protein A